jgi:hypothetical protein
MTATTENTTDNRCKACFGIGTITLMKTPKFGHPIDHSKSICSVCNGTGKSQKPAKAPDKERPQRRGEELGPSYLECMPGAARHESKCRFAIRRDH